MVFTGHFDKDVVMVGPIREQGLDAKEHGAFVQLRHMREVI
jgi:hypothetical protein